MLTFEQKLAIIESFPELTGKKVSLGRMNFHLEESHFDKKIVVYHLHPNGNGFVYTGDLPGYEINDKGYTNIRDFSEEKLRDVIAESIEYLMPKDEVWFNEDGYTLVLTHEDQTWNVYAGDNLDGTFATYAHATTYLEEEGFNRKSE